MFAWKIIHCDQLLQLSSNREEIAEEISESNPELWEICQKKILWNLTSMGGSVTELDVTYSMSTVRNLLKIQITSIYGFIPKIYIFSYHSLISSNFMSFISSNFIRDYFLLYTRPESILSLKFLFNILYWGKKFHALLRVWHLIKS